MKTVKILVIFKPVKLESILFIKYAAFLLMKLNRFESTQKILSNCWSFSVENRNFTTHIEELFQLSMYVDIILGRSPRYIVTIEYNSTVLTRFVSKSPSFDKSYSPRNILTRFVQKSPSFGKSYSTRNVITRFVQKSPSFCYSYSTNHEGA